MAKTYRIYPSEGSRTLYPVDFGLGYLDKSHVYVYKGNLLEDHTIQTQYAWINDNQIELSTPLLEGEQLVIRRITPKNQLINNYEDGSRLIEKNLDDSYKQSLMVIEELQDGLINVDVVKDLDMRGFQIKNLGAPSHELDAVNKQYVDDLVFGDIGDNSKEEIKLGSELEDGVFEFNSLEYVTDTEPRSIDVFLNGCLLYRDLDYVETSSTSVTLLVNVEADDIVSARNSAISIVTQIDNILPVNSIKGLNNVRLAESLQYSVASFYANGLRGGGIFVWRPDLPKSTHNGGWRLAPEAIEAWDGTSGDIETLLDWTGSGNGVFERKLVGFVSPMIYGAIGNGVSNDAPSIQRCLDNHRGIMFEAPPSVYRIESPLIIKFNNMHIVGQGRLVTRIQKIGDASPNLSVDYIDTGDSVNPNKTYDFNTDCIFALVPQESNGRIRHFKLADIGLWGSEADRTVHIDMPLCAYVDIENVDAIVGKSFVKSMGSSFVINYTNIRSASFTFHFELGGQVINHLFTRCYASGGSGTGLGNEIGYLIRRGAGITFNTCDVDGLNFGWDFRGSANVTMVGSNTEARNTHIRMSDDSTCTIVGGRFALSANNTNFGQTTSSHFALSGNAQCTARGIKLDFFDFTTGGQSVSPRSIARLQGTSKLHIEDISRTPNSEAFVTETLATVDTVFKESVFGEVFDRKP